MPKKVQFSDTETVISIPTNAERGAEQNDESAALDKVKPLKDVYDSAAQAIGSLPGKEFSRTTILFKSKLLLNQMKTTEEGILKAFELGRPCNNLMKEQEHQLEKAEGYIKIINISGTKDPELADVLSQLTQASHSESLTPGPETDNDSEMDDNFTSKNKL